jgi:hypothetical protein
MHRQSDHVIEDAMIAATAMVHNPIVVTRDVRDFTEFGVQTLNPFKYENRHQNLDGPRLPVRIATTWALAVSRLAPPQTLAVCPPDT